MGNALYRTYRSKTLDEVIGQSHITDTLKRALKENRISHAYLLTGPRGVGKTSVARILAREVNGLSVSEAENHLDIVEIDAASNRRIDEIRDLREKVHVAPAQATYKVYIIDEAHMLTKEAFNALLKTLEEPPEHAIFILATTEYHKLPETIISRTQRFAFHPISTDDIAAHLKQIAKKESIHIQDDALTLLAEHSGGSFRDSLSLLDQIRHNDSKEDITTEDVSILLGLAPDALIDDLFDAVQNQSAEKILDTTEAIRQQSIHPSQVAQDISKRIRTNIIKNKSYSITLITLLKSLLYVPSAPDQLIALELALLETVVSPSQTESHNSRKAQSIVPLKQHVAAPTKKPKNQPKNEQAEKTEEVAQNAPESPKKPAQNKTSPTAEQSADKVWQDIVNKLKGKHNTLYGMARMAHATYKDNSFELTCKFAFHVKRLSDSQHKKILLAELRKHYGDSVDLNCIVADKPNAQPRDQKRPDIANSGEEIENISNIFGSAEVLES